MRKRIYPPVAVVRRREKHAERKKKKRSPFSNCSPSFRKEKMTMMTVHFNFFL